MMSHLIEIDVEEDEDIKSGYTITFVFEKNEFFTNDKIVKKFHMNAEGNVENSTTKFDWKPVRFREFLGSILHFLRMNRMRVCQGTYKLIPRFSYNFIFRPV